MPRSLPARAVAGDVTATATELPTDAAHAVRRVYYEAGIAVGIVACFAAAAAVFMLLHFGVSSSWSYALLLVLVAAFLGYQAWVSERNYKRIREFLLALAPRSRDVGYVRFHGIRAIFDNGLVLQLYNPGNGPNGLVFSAFLGADGKIQLLRSEDVTAWTRVFPVGNVKGLGRGMRGDSALDRESLEPVRARLGSAVAIARLYSYSPTLVLPPGSPRYMAVAVCLDRLWMTKGGAVVGQLDELASRLQHLPTPG